MCGGRQYWRKRTTGPLGKGGDKERWGGKCVEGVGKEVIGSRDDGKKIENDVNDTRGAVNRKEIGTK